MAKLSLFRLSLVGLMLIFLLFKKPPRFWKGIVSRVGFLGFCLFLVANVISGIYLGYIDSIYRTASYSEPLFVFVFTYYFVKKDPANARRFLRAIVIGGLAVCFLGIVEYTLQQSLLDFLSISYSGPEDATTYLLDDRYGLGGRISSTFIQPVYAATGFFMYAILSAFYIRVYKPLSHRFLVLVFPAFGTLLVLLTGSRGPLVSILPAVIVFTILVGRRRAALTIACIGALTFTLSLSGMLAGITGYLGDSVAFGTRASYNVFERLDLSTTLLEIFRQNPVVGFGPGMIQKLGAEGLKEFKRIAGLENQYAAILAEGGILAGCTYLLFMVGVLTSPLKIFRTAQLEEVRHWALITLVLFVYLFTGAAFANFLVSPIVNTLVAIYAITVARHESVTAGPYRSRVPATVR